MTESCIFARHCFVNLLFFCCTSTWMQTGCCGKDPCGCMLVLCLWMLCVFFPTTCHQYTVLMHYFHKVLLGCEKMASFEGLVWRYLNHGWFVPLWHDHGVFLDESQVGLANGSDVEFVSLFGEMQELSCVYDGIYKPYATSFCFSF